MMDGVPDLGELRGDDPRKRPTAPEAVTPRYVNDAQATVETDGTVTLTMAYQGSNGTGEPVAFTMPAGLYLELMTQGLRIAGESAAHGVAHGTRILEYLERGAQARAAKAERRGGPPRVIGKDAPGAGG